MAQGQCGTWIFRQKDLFNSDRLWCKLIENSRQTIVNDFQPEWQRVAAPGFDDTVIDVAQAISLDIDDAVAGDPCAGVDA